MKITDEITMANTDAVYSLEFQEHETVRFSLATGNFYISANGTEYTLDITDADKLHDFLTFALGSLIPPTPTTESEEAK